MAEVVDGYFVPYLYVKVPDEGIEASTRMDTEMDIEENPPSISFRFDIDKLYEQLNHELEKKSSEISKGSHILVLEKGAKKAIEKVIKQYLSSCKRQ